ncbi:hypothetical protein [Calothrix sp. 336/3]|uniref:hypothetical protein n=1 Tax=Calothrix sp. 336/3 TaxID=1337936 RepID=UPI0004E45DFF|nr:hypothetical protein [Calothrix sp. 336/3]AKG20751.1 hypothetical protein IJ00_04990 [Calothrix sp. 336/3]
MNKKDIRQLINKLAAQENKLSSTQFIAPCVQGGKVRTRVAGIVYTFSPQPRNFTGWGIFQHQDEKIAVLVEEASLPQVAEYLQQMKALRLRLAYPLQGETWLAYPVNEADMRQRCGYCQPVAVHLVTEGVRFEPVIGRTDGVSWWFDESDRRADPLITEQLRQHLKQVTSPETLQFSGITPEMRTVYDLVSQGAKEFTAIRQQRQDEKRLQQALEIAGGSLNEFRDKKDHWLVEWTTGDGERHSSAISKQDLTVMSAGICLSGEDAKFDLQSLVGVVEGRYEE